MAIIRSARTKNFTIVDNEIVSDGFLSMAARGLLVTLLSKPDNWSVNVQAIANSTEGTARKTGRDAIYQLINELKEKGFIKWVKYSDGKGKYFVYDSPQEPDTENQEQAKKPDTENPDLANPDLAFQDVLTRTELQQELKDKQELICDDVPSPAPSGNLPAVADKNKPSSPNPDNVATWNAYEAAYKQRYNCPVIRNAKVNGQIAKLVKDVGGDIAPVLAAYYVNHNNGFYVQKRHPIGLLLSDAQGIYTDMMRNEQMTAAKARQQEGAQTNLSAYEQAKAMRQQKQGANHG